MRPVPATALSLAFLMAIGTAACTDAGQNVPADEPSQTGALPADPATQPEEPAAEPLPEEPAQ